MRDGSELERTWEKILAASIVPLAVLGGLGAGMWMMRARGIPISFSYRGASPAEETT